MSNIIAGDIDLDKIGKGKDVHEQAYSIFHAYNRAVVRVIMMAKEKLKHISTESQRASLERMERLIKMVIYECPPRLVSRSYNHIMGQQEYIVNRDPSFYDSKKFIHLVKHDDKREMVLDLMGMVEVAFKTVNEDELNEAWDLIFVLLYTSVKFKEHIDETHIEYGQSWKY